MPLGANARMKSSLHVVRMDLAVDVRLAHAARDQLRDLRAEVEDQDLVVHVASWSGGAAAMATRRGVRPRKWSHGEHAAPRPAARRRSRTAAPIRQSPGGRCETSAEQRRARAPARPPPSGCSATPPRPSSGPGVSRIGGVGDDALHRRRDGEAEQVGRRSRRYIIQPSRGEAPSRGRHSVDDDQPQHRQPLRREALAAAAEQHALHQRRHHADREQRPAVLAAAPSRT